MEHIAFLIVIAPPSFVNKMLYMNVLVIWCWIFTVIIYACIVSVLFIIIKYKYYNYGYGVDKIFTRYRLVCGVFLIGVVICYKFLSWSFHIERFGAEAGINLDTIVFQFYVLSVVVLIKRFNRLFYVALLLLVAIHGWWIYFLENALRNNFYYIFASRNIFLFLSFVVLLLSIYSLIIKHKMRESIQ